MSKFHVFKVDFFSLKVFCAVYENKSFTKAAKTLRINQSVVSYTIDRLRDIMNDPLFVRQAGGIVPTEKAHVILPDVLSILDRYEMLIEPKTVDPAALSRTFRICCNFYERNLIVPEVFQRLYDVAPNARLAVSSAGTNGPRLLADSEADLLIGPMVPKGPSFYSKSLFKDSYVCVMYRANPLAQVPLTLDRFLAAAHVAVSYGPDWTSEYIAILETLQGDLPQAQISVPSPGDVPNFVCGTDLIATIPKLYAKMLGDQIHVTEFPQAAFLRIEIAWNKRTHNSDVHTWFRGLVTQAAATVAQKAKAAN
jgi:DNA-binding transcriptional LysR family regulator